MFRQTLIYFLMTWLTLSCTTTSPKSKNVLMPYFTGENLGDLNSIEIRGFLTQTIYMAGGQYEIQATPITLPLIEKEARELQQERGFTMEEYNKVVDHHRFDFYDERFCIDIQISIVRFGQVSDLDQWKFELVDEYGEHYPMSWTDLDSLGHGPVVSYFNGLYGPEKKWYNQGRACSKIAIDRAKGFKIQATPTFVQWPFPSTALLYWGIEVPDSYQSYRGY